MTSPFLLEDKEFDVIMSFASELMLKRSTGKKELLPALFVADFPIKTKDREEFDMDIQEQCCRMFNISPADFNASKAEKKISARKFYAFDLIIPDSFEEKSKMMYDLGKNYPGGFPMALFFMSEVWASTESEKTGKRPSESDDKQELLMLVGYRIDKKSKVESFNILRDEDGCITPGSKFDVEAARPYLLESFYRGTTFKMFLKNGWIDKDGNVTEIGKKCGINPDPD